MASILLTVVTTEMSWVVHVGVTHLCQCGLLLRCHVARIHSDVGAEIGHVIVIELLCILVAQQTAKIVYNMYNIRLGNGRGLRLAKLPFPMVGCVDELTCGCGGPIECGIGNLPESPEKLRMFGLN